MAGIQGQIGAPPDDWLALSADERAEVQRRAADLELNESEAARWVAVSIPVEPQPESDEFRLEPQPLSSFDDILHAAESLELEDRKRLTSRLFLLLPLRDRAALVSLGLENLANAANEATRLAKGNLAEILWSSLWRFLFDPANASKLYSAPRRFDLATLFVVTAAYSLLFGILTAIDGCLGTGPLVTIVVSSVITVVAASQALLQGVCNPRGVSIIAGTVTFIALWFFLLFARPGIYAGWFVIDIVVWPFFSPVLGYISGALVGGVFLLADALRLKLEPSEQASVDDASEETD